MGQKNSYRAPVKITEFAEVSIHNKEALSPGAAFIVSDVQGRDTLSFFEAASIAELRDVFLTAAFPDPNQTEKATQFILFHAVRAKDAVQNTNSKLPNLHIHTFTDDFGGEYSHITDPAIKSYATTPFASRLEPYCEERAEFDEGRMTDIGDLIDARTRVDGDYADRFQVISLDKDHGGEAESHDILTHPGFSSFADFAKNTTDEQINEFRHEMINLTRPWVQEGMGGCRVVIDENGTNSCFSVHILAGENLDRYASAKQILKSQQVDVALQRYFERPWSPSPLPQ